MQFNTVDFLFFFPVVFALYWFVFNRNARIQNALIVVVSYIFYAFWDYRFLGLIFVSSLTDYLLALYISRTPNLVKKRIGLICSLFVNLGILFIFKYYNFFISSFLETFTSGNTSFNEDSLKYILPVGISFYTFQTLSYTIDVYRGKLKATENIVEFFAYVSFFPQLVAGPIERATHLLPQFQNKRIFSYPMAVSSLQLILGGLFKKMVIADNCAIVVNQIFDNYQDMSGSTLFMGAIFFGFQIYGDFSGYSDMAIGLARLMGFDLKQNFKYPYLSINVAEFWHRWHISLSTWFRDYVYIPLGGNQVKSVRWIFNIFVVFLLSGLWHGANFTFLVWGAVHGLALILYVIFLKTIKISKHIGWLCTFMFVNLAWVFFRAPSITQGVEYLSGIFSLSFFSIPEGNKKFLIFMFLFLIVEYYQKKRFHFFDLSIIVSKTTRWVLYYIILFVILFYAGETQTFIYFQF